MFPETLEFHIADYVNNGVDYLLEKLAPTFDSIANGILEVLLGIENLLSAIPWWGYVFLVGFLAWKATKRLCSTIILPMSILIIGVFGLWELAIGTLSIVVAAVILALLMGVPLGILIAKVHCVGPIFHPILDAMQTMPSFVYLIPTMMFFGLGKVPAVLATLIYSLPPVIRLTALGLKQVPKPAQEAAIAYGATSWQLLKEVQLPLAMPTIMAGVNQTTMMALSMVVVASMIGAQGLGQEVLLSINRIDMGRGFEAGISIVIMAIAIDRITQGFARHLDPTKR
ncbi:MAG TPA: choline ABC transporter permease subunit [Aminobacterium sp.]|uniref:ABC transporter permease n=2 Tax=Aminobacteriaceae TaxID=3029087 RepID=UPI000EDB1D89|nr:choline ABC transporter permease subunit [Aminobacterium sp.]